MLNKLSVDNKFINQI